MSKSNLVVANIQYTIKNHDDIFTVKILSDNYENAEYELRRRVLSQLKQRNVHATLDSAISVLNRSIYASIDMVTDSVKKMLSDKVKS